MVHAKTQRLLRKVGQLLPCRTQHAMVGCRVTWLRWGTTGPLFNPYPLGTELVIFLAGFFPQLGTLW